MRELEVACRFGVDSCVVYLLRESSIRVSFGGEERNPELCWPTRLPLSFLLGVQGEMSGAQLGVWEWIWRGRSRLVKEIWESSVSGWSVKPQDQMQHSRERGAGWVSRGDQEGAASHIGRKWSKYEVTEAAKDSDRGGKTHCTMSLTDLLRWRQVIDPWLWQDWICLIKAILVELQGWKPGQSRVRGE